MAIFYSSKLHNIKNPVENICWHSSESILAVQSCTQTGDSELFITEKNGTNIKFKLCYKKEIKLIAWHPVNYQLAIAWKAGGLSILDTTTEVTSEVEHVPFRVSYIQWSLRGFILFATGANGQLGLWIHTSMTTETQRIHLTSVESSIASIEIIQKNLNFNSKPPNVTNIHPISPVTSKQPLDSAIFIGGCSNGIIFRISAEVALMGHNIETTTEHLSTLAQSNAPIVKILANYKHKILLAINEDQMLIKYRFDNDNYKSITELLTLKLASQLNENPIFSWAGDMILAMTLGESVIRLWDIKKSDNYTLSPKSSLDSSRKACGVICSLAYCPKYKLLAAGLSDGRIAIWRHADGANFQKPNEHRIGFGGCSQPESSWIAQPIIDLLTNHGEEHLRETNRNIAVNSIAWDSSTGSLAASYASAIDSTTDDEKAESQRPSIFSSFILRQRTLRASIGGAGSAVAQISSQSLIVVSSDTSHFKKSEDPGIPSIRTGFPTAPDMSKTAQKPIEATESAICVEEQLGEVFCTQDHVATWNGRQLCVYIHAFSKNLEPFSSFSCEFELIGMYEQYLLTKEERQIHIRSLQGNVKQLVNFSEADGSILLTSICNGYLACLNQSGVLKLFDLTKKEVKQMYLTKNVSSIIPPSDDTIPHGARVAWLSINSDATAVALSLKESANTRPDSRVFVWHLALDTAQVFDLASAKGETLELDSDNTEKRDSPENHETSVKALSSISQRNADLVRGHHPVRHYWDLTDPRLLVVEAARSPSEDHHIVSETGDTCLATESSISAESTDETSESATDLMQSIHRPESQPLSQFDSYKGVFGSLRKHNSMQNIAVMFFVSANRNTMIVQEAFPLDPSYAALIGVEVPYIYFALHPDSSPRKAVERGPESGECAKVPSHVGRRVMREFVGLESADAHTCAAIIDFSYHLVHGEMYAALKAMRHIRSAAVWENMAKMCVITQQLDVGLLCLGKMGNAFGAMSLREVRNGDNCIATQTGELALQLGMTAEAERLFIEAGRWDLVTRLYRISGHWKEAFNVVEKHHRVRLKNTHYAYAKELQSQGRVEEAIEHFIKANMHHVEVPRMLKDQPEKLEEFVKSHPSKELQHWWARSLEARSQFEEALVYYGRVKDYKSMVRIYLNQGQEETALGLCNETGDIMACYYLAKQLEVKGDVEKAIQYYTRARAFSSAVRLCKRHNKEELLYSLAQLGSAEDKLESARYFELRQGCEEKAVLLYHAAGHLGTAIQLAFATHQYDALVTITCGGGEDDASGLTADCDPALVRRCANFFLEDSQFGRAVEVLARGKQWLEAVKLVADHEVVLTEALIERLTPPAQDSSLSDAERREILTSLGNVCAAQGLFHAACKKLTQAGDRIGAMRVLLRSGDTAKIIFFANVSKQREVYVMTANYLQTLGTWRTETGMMKTIVQFYTRAKAMDSLSAFYEACAQMEIDEYQSYEKALGALTEAYKALSRAANCSGDEEVERRLSDRLYNLKAKALVCKKFVDIQALFESDPIEALSQCQSLLEDPDTGLIIRPGHIYATMIKGLVAHERHRAAFACLQDMRAKLGGYEAVSRYLDGGTQKKIYRALDMPDLDFLDSDEAAGSESERGLSMVEDAVESIEDHVDIGVESDSDLGQEGCS